MDPYIGQIVLLGFNFATQEYALCNGATLQVQEYAALFSLISTKYGGDGKSTFMLPNMMGMEPTPGMGYYIAVNGLYPSRT